MCKFDEFDQVGLVTRVYPTGTFFVWGRRDRLTYVGGAGSPRGQERPEPGTWIRFSLGWSGGGRMLTDYDPEPLDEAALHEYDELNKAEVIPLFGREPK